MGMQSFDGDKKKLTELRLFKLSHFGQLLHYSVWSLCNQLLRQCSVDYLQTLHTFCRPNENVHVAF